MTNLFLGTVNEAVPTNTLTLYGVISHRIWVKSSPWLFYCKFV